MSHEHRHQAAHDSGRHSNHLVPHVCMCIHTCMHVCMCVRVCVRVSAMTVCTDDMRTESTWCQTSGAASGSRRSGRATLRSAADSWMLAAAISCGAKYLPVCTGAHVRVRMCMRVGGNVYVSVCMQMWM